MRNHVYFLLIALFIFSCSDSETENNIQNLTDSEHIELIKNHNDKVEINFEDLPEVSQSYINSCLLYTSPSPRDATLSRMPSSA